MATTNADDRPALPTPTGPIRDVPVDWEALEDAFENNAPEVHSYLHLTTGEVLRVVDGVADPQMHVRIASDGNYLRIDPVSSREQYRWMERFIPMVDEGELRTKHTQANDGKGAFRRFKDVLLAFPAERERWFAYRSELLHFHIQTWLDHMKIEVANVPPWGHVAQPAEPAELPRSTSTSEAPGEILRRQARELLDEIPAAELPPALAFLEFLRDRGPSSLLGSSLARRRSSLDDDATASAFDDDDDIGPAVGAR
jgi:hypothetical protein